MAPKRCPVQVYVKSPFRERGLARSHERPAQDYHLFMGVPCRQHMCWHSGVKRQELAVDLADAIGKLSWHSSDRPDEAAFLVKSRSSMS